MKNGNKTDNRSGNSNNKGGMPTRKGHVMKKNLMNGMALVVIATIFAFAPQASAQEEAASAPAPELNMSDRIVLWNEDAAVLGLNYHFTSSKIYFTDSALGAMVDAVDALVKTKKLSKKLADALKAQITPVAETGGNAVRPLAPKFYDKMNKEWEAHVTAQGCDLGTPENAPCKAFHDKSVAIAKALIAMAPEEYQFIPNGFLNEISNIYPQDAYIKRALMAQAAIFFLPNRFWVPLVAGTKGSILGNEVTFADLDDKHGDWITSMCVGRGQFAGKVEGDTNSDTLYVSQEGELKKVEVQVLEKCRFFLLPGGAPSRCEQGEFAASTGADFEGHKFLAECPEDMDSLLGKEGLYFPEKCVDPIKVTVVETTSMGLVVTGADGKKIMITCDEIASGKIFFAIPTDGDNGPTVIMPPIGKLQLELVGFYLGNPGGAASNADGAMASGAMARLIYTPWASKYVALHALLEIGGVNVRGLSPDASRDDGKRGDLLASLGLGTSVIFNRVFALSIFGKVHFTTAGFGGGGGELLARFRVHERVSIFFGPALGGYIISGVKPGSNPLFEACNSGPACKSMPDDTRFFYIGGVLGISFDLVKPAGQFKAKAESSLEPEASGPSI